MIGCLFIIESSTHAATRTFVRRLYTCLSILIDYYSLFRAHTRAYLDE